MFCEIFVHLGQTIIAQILFASVIRIGRTFVRRLLIAIATRKLFSLFGVFTNVNDNFGYRKQLGRTIGAIARIDFNVGHFLFSVGYDMSFRVSIKFVLFFENRRACFAFEIFPRRNLFGKIWNNS